MSSGRHPGPRALALLLTTAAVLGCGGGDPDAITPVPAAGTVTYDGKPLESGFLQFVPAKGKAAGANIQNGQFTLSTYDEGDGAVPGSHTVTVTATKEAPPKKGETEPGTVSLIPEKYGMADRSGLTVEIPPAGKKDILIELTK